MKDKTDLIREIHEYVTAHGCEKTATHLLVQAASAIRIQAAELEAVGAGGVQALSATPAEAPSQDVQAKIDSNTWDHFGDILPTLKAISRGDWYWGANSRCKYIEIRIDTRDGGCILYDRERVRISPEQFAQQSHPVGRMMPWPAANAIAASPTPPEEQQAEPGAVDRTGCTAGTDEECTRRGCATSCPAQQAAPKAAPAEGDWINADDVQRLVRELDVALNGEESAAPQASLCDIVGQVAQAAKVLGRPVLADPKAAPGEPIAWTPGPNPFKDWCTQWFGPDSDDDYLATAVFNLPPMAQVFREATPQQEAQEPYGWLYDWTHSSATGGADTTYTGFTKDEAHAQKHDNCIAIYTAPQQEAPKAAPGDNRLAFESWARRQPWIKDCGKASDGDAYGHWDTQKAWLAWGAALAAPQQEVQEPDHATFALWYADHIGDDNKPVRDAAWETYQAFAGCTAPQPAPAPLSEREDAERLKFVLSEFSRDGMESLIAAMHDEDGFRLDANKAAAAIDRAALAAQGGK